MARSKGQEWVLAAPAGLFAARPLQGIAAGGDAWLEFLLDPANTRFLPRAEAEQDTAWKQIIPYVILQAGEGPATRLFCYQRGVGGGETRLHALRSIGVGGHINPGDEGLFAPAGWDAYRAAVAREVAEEVAIADAVLRRRIVGVLNDDSVAVGRVHAGIVEIWELAAPRVQPRESQIAASGFQSLAALHADAGHLESWSRICLEAWDALAGTAGWRPSRVAP